MEKTMKVEILWHKYNYTKRSLQTNASFCFMRAQFSATRQRFECIE